MAVQRVRVKTVAEVRTFEKLHLALHRTRDSGCASGCKSRVWTGKASTSGTSQSSLLKRQPNQQEPTDSLDCGFKRHSSRSLLRFGVGNLAFLHCIYNLPDCRADGMDGFDLISDPANSYSAVRFRAGMGT